MGAFTYVDITCTLFQFIGSTHVGIKDIERTYFHTCMHVYIYIYAYIYICIEYTEKKEEYEWAHTRARHTQTYECEWEWSKCVDDLLECISVGGHCTDTLFFCTVYFTCNSVCLRWLCEIRSGHIFAIFSAVDALIFNYLRSRQSFHPRQIHCFICNRQKCLSKFSCFSLFVRNISKSAREMENISNTPWLYSKFHACIRIVCGWFAVNIVEYYGI